MSVLESGAPARALAVYAHPDDPEVSCAGTLATWTAAGADVRLVICCRGDKGSNDGDDDPDEVAARRATEVADAAAVLGLAGHEVLGYGDGEIENSVELRGALVERIRRLRPDVVVCPDPTAVFFGDSYVNHRDHREVGWAMLDACAPAAASPLYFPDAGEPHQVGTVLLSGTLQPDAWVEIGGALDRKVAALACHTSQLRGDPALVAELLEQRALEAGRHAGVEHAEGYRRLRLRG
jgi:LmbE family N-acetylglucosaminyl deacetylase